MFWDILNFFINVYGNLCLCIYMSVNTIGSKRCIRQSGIDFGENESYFLQAHKKIFTLRPMNSNY